MKRFARALRPVLAMVLGTAAVCASASVVVSAAQPVATFQGHTAAVTSIAYSSDGKTLASGSADKTIKLWDLALGKERTTIVGHADAINAVAYSRDGKTLVSGSTDKTMKLWDATSGKELITLKGHTLPVTTLAFSPDGKRLASVGADMRQSYRSEIKLWDWAAGATKLRIALPDGTEVRSLAFSPDSNTLSFGSGGEIKRWDVAAGKELASPKIHRYGAVNSVEYSPDGKTLAYGGGYGNRPTVITLWDLALHQQRADLARPSHGLGWVAYSPDGKTLVTWTRSYGKTEQIRLWDPIAVKERATIATDGVSAVAFSPDSKRLAVAGSEAGIKVWNIARNEQR